MSGDHRFYHLPISHYCVSVERMLAFKGIAATEVRVPYHDKTELVRATGQDYVPALLWDGTVVPWPEIPDFLEARRPSPSLYPNGWGPTARVLEHWGHQVLEEKIWRAVLTEVPPILGDDRERWVFEEMQTRARGPWHVLVQRRAEFEAEAVATLAMVDRILADRAWILGEPSLADFGIFGSLSPWLTVGRRIPPELPHLARWVERIRSLGSGTPPPRARTAKAGARHAR